MFTRASVCNGVNDITVVDVRNRRRWVGWWADRYTVIVNNLLSWRPNWLRGVVWKNERDPSAVLISSIHVQLMDFVHRSRQRRCWKRR